MSKKRDHVWRVRVRDQACARPMDCFAEYVGLAWSARQAGKLACKRAEKDGAEDPEPLLVECVAIRKF